MNKCTICGKETKNRVYCSHFCQGKDPKWRKKQSEGSKAHWQKPELREKHLRGNIEAWRNPEKRRRASIRVLGEKNPFFGKHHTEEAREKMGLSFKGKQQSEGWKRTMKERWEDPKFREAARQRRAKQVIPCRDTYIERTIQDLLGIMRISFETHKPIMGQPDIFVEPNICIFCDGDYWHANPSIYKETDVIYRDKTAGQLWTHDREVGRVLQIQGYVVLRFWEKDIKCNFDVVKDKIGKTIGSLIEERI